jgi:hypothetical protein
MDAAHTSGWDRARWGALGVLIGAAVGGVAAGVVYVEGREQLARERAADEARFADVQQSIEGIRGDLETARSFEALLRARLAAGLAADELDRANFGLSREQLQYAGVALADVDAARVGIDPGALDAAQALIQQTLATVSPDVPTQRARIVAVQRALDELLPRPNQG